MVSQIFVTVVLFSFVGCGLSATGRRAYNDFLGKPDWALMPIPDLGLEDVNENANPIFCEICKFLVGDLQTLLGNDSSKIISTLESLCADLPAQYAATCKEYVDGWTPFIIDFIENETPEEICQDITLCTAVQPEIETPRDRNPFSHFVKLFRKALETNVNEMLIRNALGNDYLCTGCKDIVGALYAELTNQQILDELVALLSEGCTICPVEAQCRAAMKKLPSDIKAFADEYLNNQTCTKIGLCSAIDNPEEEMGLFSRIFTDLLPLDFDMDFNPDGFRPRPRPRPDTEPAPRPHPFRDDDKNKTRGWPYHNHNHDRRNHTGNHRNHSDSHNERPHNPHYRPHYGPHHGRRPHNIPRPNITRWWKPAMKPFWPRPSSGGSNRPINPFKPMLPSKPNKTSESVPLPEDPLPERPTLPFDPVPRISHPDPRNPYAPRLPDSIPEVDTPWKPNRENRRRGYPAKPTWPRMGENKGHGRMKGSYRKQRSVVIKTVINTDFDNTNTFAVDDAQQETEVQLNWRCDICKYEVRALDTYMRENAEVYKERLITVANDFCDRLPATTSQECKSEVADILDNIIDRVIDDYLSPDQVCPFLKFC